jgi:hypothetical protein
MTNIYAVGEALTPYLSDNKWKYVTKGNYNQYYPHYATNECLLYPSLSEFYNYYIQHTNRECFIFKRLNKYYSGGEDAFYSSTVIDNIKIIHTSKVDRMNIWTFKLGRVSMNINIIYDDKLIINTYRNYYPADSLWDIVEHANSDYYRGNYHKRTINSYFYDIASTYEILTRRIQCVKYAKHLTLKIFNEYVDQFSENNYIPMLNLYLYFNAVSLGIIENIDNNDIMISPITIEPEDFPIDYEQYINDSEDYRNTLINHIRDSINNLD